MSFNVSSVSNKSISESIVFYQKMARPPGSFLKNREEILASNNNNNSAPVEPVLKEFLTQEEKASIYLRMKQWMNEEAHVNSDTGFSEEQISVKKKIDAYCKGIIGHQVTVFRVIVAQIFSILSALEKAPNLSKLRVLKAYPNENGERALNASNVTNSPMEQLLGKFLRISMRLNAYLRDQIHDLEEVKIEMIKCVKICKELEAFRGESTQLNQVYDELYERISLLNQCLQNSTDLFPLLLAPLDRTGVELAPIYLASIASADKYPSDEAFLYQFVYACKHFLSELEAKVNESKKKLVEATEKRWDAKLDPFFDPIKKSANKLIERTRGAPALFNKFSLLAKLRKQLGEHPKDLKVVEQIQKLQEEILDFAKDLEKEISRLYQKTMNLKEPLEKIIDSKKPAVETIIKDLITAVGILHDITLRDHFHFLFTLMNSERQVELHVCSKILSISQHIVSNLPSERQKSKSRYLRKIDFFLVQIVQRIQGYLASSNDPRVLFFIDAFLARFCAALFSIESLDAKNSRGPLDEAVLTGSMQEFVHWSDEAWDVIGNVNQILGEKAAIKMAEFYMLLSSFPIRKDLPKNKEFFSFFPTDHLPFYFLSSFGTLGESIKLDALTIAALDDVRQSGLIFLNRLEFYFVNALKMEFPAQAEELFIKFQEIREEFTSALQRPLKTEEDVHLLASTFSHSVSKVKELIQLLNALIFLLMSDGEFWLKARKMDIEAEISRFQEYREKDRVPMEYLAIELTHKLFYLENFLPLLFRPFYEIAKINELIEPSLHTIEEKANALSNRKRSKSPPKTEIISAKKAKEGSHVKQSKVATSTPAAAASATIPPMANQPVVARRTNFKDAKEALSQSIAQLKKITLPQIPGQEGDIVIRRDIMHEMIENMVRHIQIIEELSKDALMFEQPYAHGEALVMAYALLAESCLKYAVALKQIPDRIAGTDRHVFCGDQKALVHQHKLTYLNMLLEGELSFLLSNRQKKLIQELEPMTSYLSRDVSRYLPLAEDLMILKTYSKVQVVKQFSSTYDESLAKELEDILIPDSRERLMNLHQKFFPILGLVEKLAFPHESFAFELDPHSLDFALETSPSKNPEKTEEIKRLLEIDMLSRELVELQSHPITAAVSQMPAENYWERTQRSLQSGRSIKGLSPVLTALFELLQQVDQPNFGYAKMNALILNTSLLVHLSLSSLISFFGITGKDKKQHIFFEMMESKYLKRLRLYDHDIRRNFTLVSDYLEKIVDKELIAEAEKNAIFELGNGITTFTRYLATSTDEPLGQKLKKYAFLSHYEGCGEEGLYTDDDEVYIQKYWGSVGPSLGQGSIREEMQKFKAEFLPTISKALDAVIRMLRFSVHVRE